MRYLTDTQKNVVLSIVLVAFIGVVGFFMYRFFHVPVPADTNPEVASVLPQPTVPTPAVPAQPAHDPVTDSICDSVPLAISRDVKFTAITVVHGDQGDTIGKFDLLNTTACPIALSKFMFILNQSIAQPMLTGVYLSADGVPFGAPLVLGGNEQQLVFAQPNAIVTVPAFTSIAIDVSADISKYAPVGQNFSLQLSALDGENETTNQPYDWSYAATRMRVESNTFDIQ